MTILDKVDKLGSGQVKEELLTITSSEKAEKLLDTVMVEGSNSERFEAIEKFLKDFNVSGIEHLERLKQVFKLLDTLGVDSVVFTLSLARGLSYYTGIIYEAFLKDLSINSSLAAGGRYDNMIGLYSKTKKQVPGVGASSGLDVITDALKIKGLKAAKTKTQALLIGVNVDIRQLLKTANALRSDGLNIDIGIKKSISKNLEYANQYQIPFVIILGAGRVKKRCCKTKKHGYWRGESLKARRCC